MKPNYVLSISREKFWRVVVPLTMLLLAGGSLVGFLLVDNLIMPRIVHINRGWVTVPRIVGEEWEKARQKLYENGLRISVKDRAYSNSFKADHILWQDPPEGERLNTAERREIEVVVSKGSEVAPVPDVRNLNQYQAKRELRKHGFSAGKSTQKFDDRVPRDGVIRTNPGPGTTTSREVPIDLLVSKGLEPVDAEVPNVVGESLAEAKRRLEEAGLKAGSIETRTASTSAPGMVISQSVAPGKRATLGNAVNLTVSASGRGTGSADAP